MTAPLNLLGIPGSLRRNSYNRALLMAARQLLPAGTTLEICDLADIPPFNQDRENEPIASVLAFKRQIRAADAIVFATPEYNYSIPGVLKNAIDWASRPFDDSAWSGKPVAVMGASSGWFGSARAQHHLRQVFVTLNLLAVSQPEVMISNAAQAFDPQGRLADPISRRRVQELLEALAALTRSLQEAG